MRKNCIGSEGSKYLAEALKVQNSIQNIMCVFWRVRSNLCNIVNFYDFRLSDNDLGDEGMKYFAEALKVNRSIQNIQYMNSLNQK